MGHEPNAFFRFGTQPLKAFDHHRDFIIVVECFKNPELRIENEDLNRWKFASGFVDLEAQGIRRHTVLEEWNAVETGKGIGCELREFGLGSDVVLIAHLLKEAESEF